MKMSQAFPSKYLKATDIGKRKIKVRISHVDMDTVGDNEEKPILYFIGKDKGLVLNVTNANRIVAAYGDETEDWGGKDIFVFVEKVSFKGQMTDGIRVDVPRQEGDETAAPLEDEDPPF